MKRKDLHTQIYAEAPTVYPLETPGVTRVFLAGGITGCPDWQTEVVEHIKQIELARAGDLIGGPHYMLFNPRRADFPINDPRAAQEQITWERIYLDHADIIAFWFAAETIQPIVLLELGRFMDRTDKPIVIGVHPDYERVQDVLIQTTLARGKITYTDDVNDHAGAIWNAIVDHQGWKA